MALMFTIDEKENVLELIESGEDSLMVRVDEDWIPVDTTQDNPTIDDQEWLDVSEDALDYWDEVEDEDEVVTREDVMRFVE